MSNTFKKFSKINFITYSVCQGAFMPVKETFFITTLVFKMLLENYGTFSALFTFQPISL